MNIYDILEDSSPPPPLVDNLKIPQRLREFMPTPFTPIRINYLLGEVISAVYVLRELDEVGEIWLFGDEKTSPNGVPEHFTAVHEKAREYAAKVGVERLRITYPNRGGVDFLKSKFPTWSVVPDALHPTVLSPL